MNALCFGATSRCASAAPARACTSSRTLVAAPSCSARPSTSYCQGWQHVQRQAQAARSERFATCATATAQASGALDVTTMAPLGDRVLVKPREEEKVSAGGLIVPVGGSKAMQDAIIGTVVSVGEDVELPLVEGDVVIFSKYGSSDVPIPNGQVCFVTAKSILAKLS